MGYLLNIKQGSLSLNCKKTRMGAGGRGGEGVPLTPSPHPFVPLCGYKSGVRPRVQSTKT